MAWLLRRIRRGRWQENPPDFERLAEDVSPDDENKLSVWYVKDDKANLHRILAALATTRNHFAPVDYLLFDDSVLDTLGLTIEPTTGNTPDEEVNTWHRDVTGLVEPHSLDLAHILYSNAETGRLRQKEVERAVIRGVRMGKIDLEKVKDPNMKAKILGLLEKNDS